MQFGVLGPLEVRSAAGEEIPVGGPRPRALLVMLLLNAGRVVGVTELIDGQYGDDPPAGAANALQAQVSRLRRNLPAGVVEFHGAGYRLAVDPGDVDVHRFERLAREGRRLLAAGHHEAAAGTLREALGLWRGPALADLPPGSFRRAREARLEELRLVAAEDLVEAELALPEGTSVAELRRLADVHPLRERLRGQLMRALHAAGRQAEALEVFEETRRTLAEELGADPSPELAAVHLAVLRAAEPAPPPRRRLAAQLTSFVGRERELERIGALRDSRLVTITGPGGTGKTRLAIEAAGRDRREACFVDLTSAADDDQVPRAVLGALGLRETGFQSLRTADPADRLVAALADRESLLVLDNCEHVIAGTAVLARGLLAECPGLRVLATSREPLGITGETLVPLAPLPTPPPDLPPRDAAAYPAVRLFADRAAAVRPGFEVGPDNAAAVVRICAALDGLPLAIELAAARLRSFTAEEIAGRLAEHGRFRLLSRGDRTAAARHRTLRAVVEWSWDLLTPDERALARRFAVFTGGASLEAVEEVCGVDAAAGLLADLVDRSLVEADGDRYRMLNTILLFCAEKLAESGEGERLRAAHARHFLGLAERAGPHLLRAGQLRWLERLSAEHGNLMAALRWAVRGDRGTAMRLVAALAIYWWLSGRRAQAGEAAAELLDAAGGPPKGLEEEYVVCVAHAVPRAPAGHWERAGEIMRSLDRPTRHPFTVALWGMLAGPSGPIGPEAERLLGSDPWNRALGRLSRALLAVFGGEIARGEREFAEALTEFRDLGERWGTAQALDGLALIAGLRGEWARAREPWGEALRLMEELGALEESADLLAHRAEALVRQGDPAAAVADYRRAGELARKAGWPDAPAEVHLGLGRIAWHRGDLVEARRLFGAALRAAEDGPLAAGTRTRALTALGRLAGAEGDPAGARLRHRRALAAARGTPLTSDLAAAAEGWAGAVLLEHGGEPATTADGPATVEPASGTAGTGRPGTVMAGTTRPVEPASGTARAGESARAAGERAALLLGAAVALRGTAVAGDRDVARTAAEARDLAGVEAFAAAFARGAAMRRDEARAVLDAEAREAEDAEAREAEEAERRDAEAEPGGVADGG
ncbi:BTAD domain-containing putative transcriptional regulator [Streptosporangium pseudovulgare]|uniref:SARP family transcriptional regulator n=1 Tax=Streptosporangium pseudovulgare TaxID=35765 RepID=A0ABQ2QYE6_9ACTN|nr:BTAD domain-containing putative transcriptional regulator [Streptosporangium pseudovulgare]GGQ04229.1 SARP family transcriptional regulator [Streptosporangium pseudovulgare]